MKLFILTAFAASCLNFANGQTLAPVMEGRNVATKNVSHVEKSAPPAEVTVYPNPGRNGELNVTVDAKETHKFNLYSGNGRLLRAVPFSENTRINIKELEKGAYPYTVSKIAGEIISRGRLVIE
jgi:hypothetical protein